MVWKSPSLCLGGDAGLSVARGAGICQADTWKLKILAEGEACANMWRLSK